jgi:Protein of unknown function (DUF3302)
MSGLDIFAWIVLIVLAASAVGVFCIAGWLPGHIAKTRGHPWADAVRAAGWIALIWAYVDVPARRDCCARSRSRITSIRFERGMVRHC